MDQLVVALDVDSVTEAHALTETLRGLASSNTRIHLQTGRTDSTHRHTSSKQFRHPLLAIPTSSGFSRRPSNVGSSAPSAVHAADERAFKKAGEPEGGRFGVHGVVKLLPHPSDFERHAGD